MILLIDNYDSFTHNLHHYVAEVAHLSILIKKNDEITIEDVKKINPKLLIISPGPGKPEDSGHLLPLLNEYYKKVPILGVCLGHQALAAVFSAKIIHAPSVMHGKTSWIEHDQKGIFSGIPTPMEVMRYHSLCVEESSLSEELRVTARTDDGCIMALRHKTFPLETVQFHPESILTKQGKKIIHNFIQLHVFHSSENWNLGNIQQ